MRTSCEIFAERGDPWDSRIHPTFGLTKEPPRVVRRRNGDVEAFDDEQYRDINWGPVQLPPRKGDGARVKPAVSNADARRVANMSIRGHRAKIFSKGPAPVEPYEPKREETPHVLNEPTPELTAEQRRVEWQKFLAKEREEMAERRRCAS